MGPDATNPWANVELPPGDPEVLAIDRARDALGDLPGHVLGVRELITRFEACHFKQARHYRHVLESIAALRPTIETESIGAHHLRHGRVGIARDTTGRSALGQLYVDALESWLGCETPTLGMPRNETASRVWAWLGPRDPCRDQLVRMLVDRLLYRRLDEYLAAELSELDHQVLRTDICHHTFPGNLERVVQAIGLLRPLKEFEGCGTCDVEVTHSVHEQFAELCGLLTAQGAQDDPRLGQGIPTGRWLVMSFAKTLKEQAHLPDPVPGVGR